MLYAEYALPTLLMKVYPMYILTPGQSINYIHSLYMVYHVKYMCGIYIPSIIKGKCLV